jgi:flagellar hook-length control protein FliK
MDSQIHIELIETEIPQVTATSVERAEISTSTHAAINSEAPLFIEVNEVSKGGHITLETELRTISDETPPTLINSSTTSSSSQPGPSVRIETGNQIRRAKFSGSKNEDMFSSEKQPKLSQVSGSPAASTDAIKDAMGVEGNNRKAPAGQVNSQAVEVAQQVIHQMNVKIKNGPTSMHLQLSPTELGNIEVEMVSTSQGVHVTFFTEQANTGKLLETQLNQLRESLIDSGVQLSGLNISQQGLAEQKGGFDHNTNFTQNSLPEFVPNETNNTKVSHPERTTGQLGKVDYRV